MLTQLDYPVTGDVGSFNNIFPSQKELNVNFNRLDVTIASIASGTGGIVELTLDDPLDANLIEGDFVVWQTDSYKLRVSRVVQVISPTVIETDDIFNSSDATNGFMNYRKSWYLEARFVEAETPTDQQDNVELVIKDFSRVPNALDGSLALDLSIVKDVLSPVFSIASGLVDSLSKLFKFQYRESYEGNRSGLWVSPNIAPANDTPIMLVMASKDVVFNNFTDENVNQVKFAESYPILYSYIYSDINDNGTSTLKFRYEQYTLDKQLINNTDLGSFSDVSGVINLLISPDDIDGDAVFIKPFVELTTLNEQYDPTQYDPTQYT